MDMKLTTWLWALLATAYAFVLLEFTEQITFFVPNGYHQTTSRFILALTFGLVIWRYLPSALARLKARPSRTRLAISAFIIIIIIVQVYGGNGLPDVSFRRFLFLIFATKCIGFSEEFLSRGVIFALFEKHSIWLAVAVSSISFGAMHYMGFYEGADFGRVTWRVIGAASAGVLFAGLMLFTGSLWVPIVFHSLYNLPFLEGQEGTSVVVESPATREYIMAIATSSLSQVALGLLLAYYSAHEPLRLKRVLLKFKLIEEPHER
ncbi:MAG: CPBP family intramembrane metalloprotease [Candidatus Planktophila sp.]|nr:CPBP family intramembrane metalloprotease [Candidatus Planktophila sp.]